MKVPQWFMVRLLKFIMDWFPPDVPPENPDEAVGFDFTFGPVSEIQFTKESSMGTLILKDSQQALVKIAPKSKAGNPAAVDGAPVWQSSDPTVVLVTPEADGLSATVSAVGPVGVATVTVTADADVGEGVKTISDGFNVSVEGGEASTLGFDLGTPEEKPV